MSRTSQEVVLHRNHSVCEYLTG